jgi:L-ascorbate metabolism protein UlaG (beta-lactamase superfamily)
MRIKWLAHATFLIEGDGLRIITDPYCPETMGFPPVQEPADVVIRSSATDLGHCYAEMVPGHPAVITATEILENGARFGNLNIKAIPVKESLIYKSEPLDNAMYRFELEGIQVAHMGDVGNRLSEEQLAALEGSDVLIAPVGGPPTIDLADLKDAITYLRPRIVVPGHYALPGSKSKMFPVTDFTALFPADEVKCIDRPEIVLTHDTLPLRQVVVLQAGVLKNA